MTYGIYSSLDCYKNAGTIMIATDVANENVDECLKDIYTEMELLQNEPVSENELELVRKLYYGFISE